MSNINTEIYSEQPQPYFHASVPNQHPYDNNDYDVDDELYPNTEYSSSTATSDRKSVV